MLQFQKISNDGIQPKNSFEQCKTILKKLLIKYFLGTQGQQIQSN